MFCVVRGRESTRRVAEDEAGEVNRERQVMRSHVVTLRGLDLTLGNGGGGGG